LHVRPRCGAFGVLLAAFMLAPHMAGGTPLTSETELEGEPGRIEVEIALVGQTAQAPTLTQAISTLAQSEGLTPLFVHLAEIPRQELVDVAARPTPGRVRVWIDLLQPNQALLLLSGPTGQSYIVRELPVGSTLDEVDREQIAQVVQSSTLALLHGERGLDRISMQRALGVNATPTAPPVPAPLAAPAEPGPNSFGRWPHSPAQRAVGVDLPSAAPPTPAAYAAPAEPTPNSFGRWTFGPSYSLAWTGAQLKERHALGLRFGVTEIVDSKWSLVMAVYAGLPQQHSASLIGLKTRDASLYVLLGHAWPMSESFGALGSLGLGLTNTQVTPLASQDNRVNLRESTNHFRPTLRAEFGIEFVLSSYALLLGPTLDVHFNRTHYDVLRESQRIHAATPWLVVPGVQLTLSYRQPTSTTHERANSGVHFTRS
jgi:hypothetical protein